MQAEEAAAMSHEVDTAAEKHDGVAKDFGTGLVPAAISKDHGTRRQSKRC